jgi:hypothetical protein
VVDKAALGQDFRFPLPNIPPITPHSSSPIIIQGWYNRPLVVSVIVDSVSLHLIKGGKISVGIAETSQNILLLST